MKRVLVTGASGFIGRHALRPLQELGYEVHAVARNPLAEPAIHWHHADLLDSGQTAQLVRRLRPTHLLHLAWYAEHGKFWNSPENFAWVKASIQLMEAFADNGGLRFVAAGSCAEYDWKAGHCDEAVTPLVPVHTYGVCKDIFRRYQQEYANHRSLSAAWGRIFHLYGPAEHPARLAASVIASLDRNEPALCSHGRQVRDFMHVSDSASAFAALLDSDVEGAVNIASGQPTTIRDLVSSIAKLMQKQDLLRLGTLNPRTEDPPILTAQTRRLQQEVGWKPTFDLNSGLAQTIAWSRKVDQAG